MNEHTTIFIEGLDREEMSKIDMDEPLAPHLKTTDEQTRSAQVEVHYHQHAHDHSHVDLMKDEYLPHEVADMLGTSLKVVLRAVRYGDLKAKRLGQHVVSIPRAALLEWYKIER